MEKLWGLRLKRGWTSSRWVERHSWRVRLENVHFQSSSSAVPLIRFYWFYPFPKYQSGTAVSKNSDAIKKAQEAIAADLDAEDDDDEDEDDTAKAEEVAEAVKLVEQGQADVKKETEAGVGKGEMDPELKKLASLLPGATAGAATPVKKEKKDKKRWVVCSLLLAFELPLPLGQSPKAQKPGSKTHNIFRYLLFPFLAAIRKSLAVDGVMDTSVVADEADKSVSKKSKKSKADKKDKDGDVTMTSVAGDVTAAETPKKAKKEKKDKKKSKSDA